MCVCVRAWASVSMSVRVRVRGAFACVRATVGVCRAVSMVCVVSVSAFFLRARGCGVHTRSDCGQTHLVTAPIPE